MHPCPYPGLSTFLNHFFNVGHPLHKVLCRGDAGLSSAAALLVCDSYRWYRFCIDEQLDILPKGGTQCGSSRWIF
jgi:hypothetical protein